jgi:hypothetical protein
MKMLKTKISLKPVFFFLGVLCMTIIFLGCQHRYGPLPPVIPTPTLSPTATLPPVSTPTPTATVPVMTATPASTATPTSTSVWVFPATPTPAQTATGTPCTPVNMTSVSVAYPSSAAVSTAPFPSGLGAHVFVIRDETDWEAYCGTTTPPLPPVDFSSQMILVAAGGWVCNMKPSFVGVCEGTGQVTVNIAPPGTPMCYIDVNGTVAVAVPNSPSPVVWDVGPLTLP